MANLNSIGGREGIYQLSSGADRAYSVVCEGQPVCHLILLPVFDALRCWKANIWGEERVFLSPAALLFDGDTLRLRATQVSDLWFGVYPAPPLALCCPDDSRTGINQGPFSYFHLAHPEADCPVEVHRLQPAGLARAVREVSFGENGVAQAPGDADFEQAEIWQVDFPEGLPAGAVEVRLRVDYTGDAARATLNGELVSDDFYAGRPWEIALRRLDPQALAGGLVLKFLPLRRDAPIYLPGDWRSAAGEDDSLLEVREIRAEVEYEVAVSAEEDPAGD